MPVDQARGAHAMTTAARITAPGLYPGIPAEAYHGDKLTPEPALSSSGARKIMSSCPAQFWWDHENPPEPTEALDVGSAAHEWLLEGDTWPQRFTVLPEDHNGATKAGKARIEEIEASGKRPLKHDAFATINAMHDALVAHEFALSAFSIWCRARLDAMPRRGTIFADYKTCRSADPDDLRKSIADYGYHQQAAWYCEGIRALGICPNPTFLFVFQQKTPPYLITPVVLDQTTLDWGAALNRKAKAIFAHGLRTGQWAGYADDIITLGLPVWATKQLEDMEALGKLAAELQAPNGWSAAA
jgi:hypothetical protein